MTLGPEPPASLGAFARDVFTTDAGWTLIVVGVGVGFLFALLVLMISVVSFPLLLDRDVGLLHGRGDLGARRAHQPGADGGLGADRGGRPGAGSIPVLLGLIVVMPVLGHATWHLYRKVVPR